MKPRVIDAITRIAGDQLTPRMKEEIADEAIRIIAEVNKAAAMAASKTFEQTMATESVKDSLKNLK